jgi:23S rRNA (cytosine1962-C5)-methyltransferase
MGEFLERIEIDKSGEESIVSGHLWIFSNQIKRPPSSVENGGLVEVTNEKGRFFGIATYNRHSLIAARLLSRDRVEIDEAFFARRMEDSLKARAGRFGESFRMVNSESDFLPGLIVDKYEHQVVVQMLTAGMDRQRDNIIHAIGKALSPRAIVVRNDSASRKDEGLPQYVEVAEGTVESPSPIAVGPLRFLTDILSGHKTGFYFDQRENRLLMKDFAEDRKVLDLFSYTGGFGLHALHFGARSVTFVDASSQALDICKENCRLNGLKGAEFVRADGFDFLKESTEGYGVIVLDPPSFIKSKKKLKEGEKGYIDLNKKALRRIVNDGTLFTFSCSYNMKRARFRDILRIAAYGSADLFLLKEMAQAGDHPVLLTIPETDYLKGFILKVRKRPK